MLDGELNPNALGEGANGLPALSTAYQKYTIPLEGQQDLNMADGFNLDRVVQLDIRLIKPTADIDLFIDGLHFGLPGQGITGDFDNNGVVDAADIDLLCAELGGANGDFDLTGDGMVNSEDADELILVILGTEYGDADLMGSATLGDLGTLAGNFTSTRTDFGWADGDFNWDGEVTLADLGILAANFGANGPIPQAESELTVEDLLAMISADWVPEPATGGLLVLCCLGLLSRRGAGSQRHPGTLRIAHRRFPRRVASRLRAGSSRA